MNEIGLTAKQKSYIIMDAGGTYLKSAVLDEDGTVHALSVFTTRSHSEKSKEIIIRAFAESISQGLAYINIKKLELKGIGIAIPGPFNYQNGIPLMTHKFQSLYGVALGELIAQTLGIDCNIPILFIHDANAVLYGEQWLGNAQGYANNAVVTIGTGLGFTHSQNKIVQCTDLGSPSVSIFKIPYKQGILEDYVSRRGFLYIYGKISGRTTDEMNVSDIAEFAGKGDKDSLDTFREIGQILSRALIHILVEKNIECLLFAGQISRSFHYMKPALNKGLKGIGSLKQISTVKSIDYAAFYGVLLNILNLKKQIKTCMPMDK